MKKHAPPGSTERARRLRRDATEAERRMECLLKECFPQARFRSQVPFRHYFADFASHRLRLIVEVDGGQHKEETDRERTIVLEHEGYRVIRFWNHDVLENGEGCMAKLAEIMGQPHPHPATTRRQAAKSSHPSPIKGEEK